MSLLKNKEGIKRVLTILEKQVDQDLARAKKIKEKSISSKKTTTKKSVKESVIKESNQNLQTLAEEHFKLQERINKLADELSTLEGKKQGIDEEIFDQVKRLKGKSIKFGKILIMIETTIQKTAGKTTYKYKNIIEDITEVYEFEKNFINRLFRKYKSVSEPTSNTTHDLIITKEARQLIKYIESKTGKKVSFKKKLNEGFIDWIKKLGSKFLSYLSSFVNEYSTKVDSIEKQARQLGLLTEDAKAGPQKHKAKPKIVDPWEDIQNAEEGSHTIIESEEEELNEYTQDEKRVVTGREDMYEEDELNEYTHDETRAVRGREDIYEDEEMLEEEDYPWDKCIKDQKKEYGSKKTAQKVCGSIKAHNEAKDSKPKEKKLIAKNAKELEDIRSKYKGKFVFVPSGPGGKVTYPVKVTIH